MVDAPTAPAVKSLRLLLAMRNLPKDRLTGFCTDQRVCRPITTEPPNSRANFSAVAKLAKRQRKYRRPSSFFQRPRCGIMPRRVWKSYMATMPRRLPFGTAMWTTYGNSDQRTAFRPRVKPIDFFSEWECPIGAAASRSRIQLAGVLRKCGRRISWTVPGTAP